MSLISAGQGLRRTANLAQSKVASADVAAERMRIQNEMANEAGEQQVLGTAAGIGSMVGTTRMFKNAEALEQGLTNVNKLVSGGEVGAKGGGLTWTPTGQETALTGEAAMEGINAAAANADKLAATASTTAEGATVAADLAAAGEVAAAGTEAVAAGEAALAVEGAAGAASSSGMMGTLGTIAAPVAIALGVGFLFNKLFD